jgi:predicted P-loop ATPase
LQFLSDPTGNRRWLPFEVDSIEPPHDNPLDYNGIYSQAYALYRQGFRYWFTQQEIERLAQHNQQFETANLELELVAQYFRKPQGQEPGEFISAAMALQIIGANITQKLSKEYVGRAFTSLGFDSRRTNKMRGYIVVRRSAEEMRSMRYQLAAPSKSDSDGGDSIF